VESGGGSSGGRSGREIGVEKGGNGGRRSREGGGSWQKRGGNGRRRRGWRAGIEEEEKGGGASEKGEERWENGARMFWSDLQLAKWYDWVRCGPTYSVEKFGEDRWGIGPAVLGWGPYQK